MSSTGNSSALADIENNYKLGIMSHNQQGMFIAAMIAGLQSNIP